MSSIKASQLPVAGKNCWKTAEAQRVTIFHDTAEYYDAFADAVTSAQHHVYIAGWDIHSRLRVRRGEEARYPMRLEEVLEYAVERNPSLSIYILLWDFSLIYIREREFLPTLKFREGMHERIHFQMDSTAPMEGSKHEKIVVIDDHLSFSGGVDLSQWRWDTWRHEPKNPLRRDPSGNRYLPFHDVQAGMTGPISEALSAHFRNRWKEVTGISLPPSPHQGCRLPTRCDIEEIPAALSRTHPRTQDHETIREAEQMYLDSIDAATKWIYIENQYLTSLRITEKLAASLRAPVGPEIIIIGPKRLPGWLEEGTMGIMREKMLRVLRDADAHNRLMVLYPAYRNWRGKDYMVMVHAKLMIVDNHILRVASSNLSNRSMGVDSEMDVIFTAADPRHEKEIAAIRNGFLSRHLDVTIDRISSLLDESESMIHTISLCQKSHYRSLYSMPQRYTDLPLESFPSHLPFADATEPVRLDLINDDFPDSLLRNKVLRPLIVILSFLALAALWRWTPLQTIITPEALQEWGHMIQELPFQYPAVLLIFILASLLMVPLTVMVVATVLLYGPVTGFFYSISGAWCAAGVTWLAGRLLLRDSLHHLAGRWTDRLQHHLKKGSILIIAALRLMPVAPYTIINMAAGSLKIHFGVFMAGTLLGLIPGLAGLALAGHQFRELFQEPSARTFLITGGILAGIFLLFTGTALLGRKLLMWRKKRD